MGLRITFIHSLNNYTGSPKVLSTIVKAFVAKGYTVELITSKGSGFLSDIPGVKYRYTCYRWTNLRALTAMLLFLSQLQVFFMIMGGSKTNRIFYINTIIPFGAAWACYLKRAQYVYHVHEDMAQAKPLYRFLRFTYKVNNRKSVFVSNYLRAKAKHCKNGIVVYNALDQAFLDRAANEKQSNRKRHTVLMVSSLKRYKGVYEFLELAKIVSQYRFQLVLSVSELELNRFRTNNPIPENLEVFGLAEDLHLFYQRAKVLTVLSNPLEWIETFGMTILEGMTYGVPAIVPPVGGPTELVADGQNGFQVNVKDLETLSDKITALFEDEALWQKQSTAAIERSKLFKPQQMVQAIENYLFK